MVLEAMARDDKTIEVIELNTRQIATPAAAANVTLLAWTPDDQAIYAVTADNNVTRRQLPASGAPAGTVAQALTFAAPAPVSAVAALAVDRVALQAADGQVAMFAAEAATAAEAAGAGQFRQERICGSFTTGSSHCRDPWQSPAIVSGPSRRNNSSCERSGWQADQLVEESRCDYQDRSPSQSRSIGHAGAMAPCDCGT